MEPQDPRLLAIWKQAKIPVVFRRGSASQTLVRLPFEVTNGEWLRGERRRKPQWNTQFNCWETPASWFDPLIDQAVKKFGRAYVLQGHRAQQKCAPACWNAQGYHCECSCMGEHHGVGHPGGKWREVSETFALSWGDRRYACRLIVAKLPGTH